MRTPHRERGFHCIITRWELLLWSRLAKTGTFNDIRICPWLKLRKKCRDVDNTKEKLASVRLLNG